MRDDEGWGPLPEAPTVGEPGASGGIQSFEDLRVWQEAVALCERVYAVTRSFPDDERFGLTSQLRRATVSVSSNIAEGWGRGSRSDYARFLRIARGSLFEVKTQLVIAERVGFLTPKASGEAQRHVDQVRRMLHGLVRSLERSA
ncbi:MAG: four helix bundle protein [Bacteroidota bacterium]